MAASRPAWTAWAVGSGKQAESEARENLVYGPRVRERVGRRGGIRDTGRLVSLTRIQRLKRGPTVLLREEDKSETKVR